ncbi:Phosphotransferase enzyme family protein [Pseudoruegeria aquimaris]|uniref:Phosphotransferase enzyme family protein n=1 Tax=Pseudoruegeria aquimaris TaxID=393663 RepID=A0A1Y5RWL8_9RHOB|nr:phosphotransferase [Pseudoruegeria aquimaris]SLN24283.1 Phosphotransferase enzyme family protein [Pseudoruegeria aquimaris]
MAETLTETARHFLDGAGWGGALHELLRGDASARRYLRLTRPDSGDTAILMVCPPGSASEMARFAQVGAHLRAVGLSAPDILAEAMSDGLMLLEDFGDASMAAFVDNAPEAEQAIYLSATKIVHYLHAVPPMEGLHPYGPAQMAPLVDLAFTDYAAATGKGDPGALPAIEALLRSALQTLAPDTDVMILRDYHAENLMVLPERSGVRALGLLDFQDALSGHRAYDLVSLLEDARRDISESTRLACISWYVHENALDPEAFEAALAVQGAQRNLRILGVFARLARARGKPGYLDLMPRVWGHLQRDLDHPALADLRTAVLAAIPAPEADVMERLRQQCPAP